MEVEKLYLSPGVAYYFRGTHLIGGRSTESTCLDFRPHNNFQWARIEARVWLHLTLCLFLEVRKLLNLQGVAYLEGRFKSRSYGMCTHTQYYKPYTAVCEHTYIFMGCVYRAQ